MTTPERRFRIAHVLVFMKARLDKPPSMKQICVHFSVSQSHLSHLFKKECGISPMKFMLRLRIERAQLLLRDTPLKVCEIAYRLNFSDSSYFSRVFKRVTGMTPLEYRYSTKAYVEEEKYVRFKESKNRYRADCLD